MRSKPSAVSAIASAKIETNIKFRETQKNHLQKTNFATNYEMPSLMEIRFAPCPDICPYINWGVPKEGGRTKIESECAALFFIVPFTPIRIVVCLNFDSHFVNTRSNRASRGNRVVALIVCHGTPRSRSLKLQRIVRASIGIRIEATNVNGNNGSRNWLFIGIDNLSGNRCWQRCRFAT